jgi:hypothetical protein
MPGAFGELDGYVGGVFELDIDALVAFGELGDPAEDAVELVSIREISP